MKLTNLLLFFPLLFVACKSEPSSPPTDQPFDYGCETTLAQLQGVDSLVGVMQGVNAWGDDASLDSISNMNDQIYAELSKLLACGAVEKLELKPETFENLYYAQTPDGRIRNFNWYANNGGTWQEMRRIYQYYPLPHVAKTTAAESLAGATSFYQLKSEEPMYLGFGADKTCSTCIVEYASMFSFKNDTLDIRDVLVLDARMGSVLEFEFDTTAQMLNYKVLVDDLNQDWAAEKPKKKVSDLQLDLSDMEGWEPSPDDEVVVGTLVFDGKGFVEKN